jgi:hypothetical protein
MNGGKRANAASPLFSTQRACIQNAGVKEKLRASGGGEFAFCFGRMLVNGRFSIGVDLCSSGSGKGVGILAEKTAINGLTAGRERI